MLEWLLPCPVWSEEDTREVESCPTITIINTGEKQMGGQSNPGQADRGRAEYSLRLSRSQNEVFALRPAETSEQYLREREGGRENCPGDDDLSMAGPE